MSTEKKTLKEYERERAKICGMYDHMCYTKKCPLRRLMCYEAITLRNCELSWRKKLCKAIDDTVRSMQ